MVKKKMAVRGGILLIILFIGLTVLYNYYWIPQSPEPVKVYKYTELPARSFKSVKAGAESKVPILSDSEDASESFETSASLDGETPEDAGAVEESSTLEVDVTEFVVPSLEETVSIDFKTTPPGYPLTPYWDRSREFQDRLSYQHRLLDHVLVKLYNQGTRDFVGGSIGKNGRVHPHYRNTLYVKWKEFRSPDGTLVPIISKSFGGGDVRFEPRDIFDLPPPSVRLIDLDSPEGQGIDPYAFLTSMELP